MLTHPNSMTPAIQLEGTWSIWSTAASQAGEGSTARTSSTALLNLGGCCRRKRTAPSPAPHCAVPRSRAASHAARKHTPHPPHPPATPRRAPWGATPRRRASMAVATAVQRSFLRGGRRVSFAGRRSSVVVLQHAGAACRAVARSRFASSGRRERARPPRDATRGNGAVHGALDLRWVIWGCLVVWVVRALRRLFFRHPHTNQPASQPALGT